MKIEEKLKNYSQMSSIEIFKDLKTSIDGISFTEIEEKQEEYGKNVIDIKNNNTTLSRLKEVFINPFNIVLIIVAIITFFNFSSNIFLQKSFECYLHKDTGIQ